MIQIGPLELRLIFCDRQVSFYRWFYNATEDFTLQEHMNPFGYKHIGLSGGGKLIVMVEGVAVNLESIGQSLKIKPSQTHTLNFSKEAGPFDGWMAIIPPENRDSPICENKSCGVETCEILRRSYQIE